MALRQIFGQDGDRSDVINVVVVVTDGIPTFPQPNPRYVVSFSCLITNSDIINILFQRKNLLLHIFHSLIVY